MPQPCDKVELGECDCDVSRRHHANRTPELACSHMRTVTRRHIHAVRDAEAATVLTLAQREAGAPVPLPPRLTDAVHAWMADVHAPHGQFAASLESVVAALLERHPVYMAVHTRRLARRGATAAFGAPVLAVAAALVGALLRHGAALVAAAVVLWTLTRAGTGGGAADDVCVTWWRIVAPRCYVRAAAAATLDATALVAVASTVYVVVATFGARVGAWGAAFAADARVAALEDAVLTSLRTSATRTLRSALGTRLLDAYDALLHLPPEQRAYFVATYGGSAGSREGSGANTGGPGANLTPLRTLLLSRMEAAALRHPAAVAVAGAAFDVASLDALTAAAAGDYARLAVTHARLADGVGDAQIDDLRSAVTTGLRGVVQAGVAR